MKVEKASFSKLLAVALFYEFLLLRWCSPLERSPGRPRGPSHRPNLWILYIRVLRVIIGIILINFRFQL